MWFIEHCRWFSSTRVKGALIMPDGWVCNTFMFLLHLRLWLPRCHIWFGFNSVCSISTANLGSHRRSPSPKLLRLDRSAEYYFSSLTALVEKRPYLRSLVLPVDSAVLPKFHSLRWLTYGSNAGASDMKRPPSVALTATTASLYSLANLSFPCGGSLGSTLSACKS